MALAAMEVLKVPRMTVRVRMLKGASSFARTRVRPGRVR